MYMLFTSQKNSYPLSKPTFGRLEKELMETIARNPSEVYGKDETLIDKLTDMFSARSVKEATDRTVDKAKKIVPTE